MNPSFSYFKFLKQTKRCKFNQKCKPHGDYLKINSNDQLDIKGLCLTGCNGDGLSFKYDIYALPAPSNKWTPFTQFGYFYVSNKLGTDLTLKEDLFRNFSSQIIWKIELTLNIASRNVSGKTSLLFFVNFPPHLGLCMVTPQNGSTLTLFQIKCSGWTDPEGSLVQFDFYG